VIDVPFFGESEVTGRTPSITGAAEIEPGRGETVIQSGRFVGDLTQLTSGDTLVDNQVRRLLQVDQFPTAEFTILRPVPLPPDDLLRAGAIVPLPGELSLLGQSREVIVPARFLYSGDRLVVTASIEFRLADFGIPNDQGLFSVADGAAFEFELQLTPGG
jgi:polyisoprenoid-binding protein YceI